VEAAVARASLLFTGGPRAGEEVPLALDMLTLGTSPRSSVLLPDEHGWIAREHLRIWRHGDNYLLREVDGAGTLIGGHPLETPVVVLEDGDELTLGPYRMRFKLLEPPGQLPGD
jgi:predicted component of type VI protein secretion system